VRERGRGRYKGDKVPVVLEVPYCLLFGEAPVFIYLRLVARETGIGGAKAARDDSPPYIRYQKIRSYD
jgi:hypothetical protein